MADGRTYMAAGEDEFGDQHVLITADRDRAIAAYWDFVTRYGSAQTNEGLAAALREQSLNS